MCERDDRFGRTRLLVGDEGLARLREARVAVFGLGGVGGYAFEALARAGVGYFYLADAGRVRASNVNRQLLALDGTVGRLKVKVARDRLGAINPGARADLCAEFLNAKNAEGLVPEDVAFAVEAIDTLAPKVRIIETLHARGVPHAVCLGASSRLSPTSIRVGDISEVRNCPLARRVRQRLRKRGILSGVRCVFSDETPQGAVECVPPEGDRVTPRSVRGTISYVPGIVGLTAAGLVINDILTGDENQRGPAL